MTADDLKKNLFHRIETKAAEFSTRTMHMLERPLKSGTVLQIGPNRHEVKKDAYLVIIDEDPGAYWVHPVRYELHDTATGEIQAIQEEHPLESPDVGAELLALHIPDLPALKKKGNDSFFELRPPRIVELDKWWKTRSYGCLLYTSDAADE